MQPGKIKLTAALLLLAVVPAFFVLAACTASGEPVRITVIHINDTHGRTQAEPYISALAQGLRGKGENVLIFDAGDRLHGQTAANLTKGESMAEVMNAAGYDAMVPGNHDFAFGVPRLAELSEMMHFPLLAANVQSNGKNIFDSYKIFTMNGLKVGVFGIATPETIASSDPRVMAGLSFGDPAQTARAAAGKLKAQGCKVIIALAHLGGDELSAPADKSDALAAVPGIDVIIDGHSHTLLENGRISGGALIAQAGEYAQHIGIVEIAVSGSSITKTARVIPIPKSGEAAGLIPDQEVIAVIAGADEKIKPITSVAVSQTPVLLNGERESVRTGETNLSNLIADSMLWATGADIAILTGGNIRSSIPAGDITMGHILTVLPYSNLLVTVELSGADLLSAFEHGVSLYPAPAGLFIQVAGVSFEFDPHAEQGCRVQKAAMVNGATLDANKTYTVATIDFIAAGGDGYTMVAAGAALVYYGGNAEAFADYLATDPAIGAEPEGRITVR